MTISWVSSLGPYFSAASALFWGAVYATNVGAIKSIYTWFYPNENHESIEDGEALRHEFGLARPVDLRRGALGAMSTGSRISSCFRNTIVLNDEIARLDRDAIKWLMRREFCLLESTSRVVVEWASCVSSVAMSFLLPAGLNFGIAMSSDMFLHYLFDGMIKRHADSVACSQASKKELKGALRLFHACCEAKNEFSKEKKKYIDGEFFQAESPAAMRFEKAKKALKKRFRWHNEKINKCLADERVDKLKNYILPLLLKANKLSEETDYY